MLLARAEQSCPARFVSLPFANLVHSRAVEPSVDRIVSSEDLLSIGRVHDQRRAAPRIHRSAFMRREVSWPYSRGLDNSLLYCHCKYMSTTKDDRLQIRVGPADKALLERAAAASHLNVSAFVVQAAASKAEEVLAERSSIRLSAQAAAAFTEALERPAEANQRLAKALRRKRNFTWLD
jgi:uncharacterized protein (DUF1778 family)